MFQKLLDKNVVVFIHNILISSYGLRKQYTELILQVLEKCEKHSLAIELSKCEYYKKRLWFLEDIFSGWWIEIDKDYIEKLYNSQHQN